MATVALIFSCDANYFPLAKGLVLSLADSGIPNSDISLNIADVGCGEDDVAWLRDRGVNVVPFSILDHYDFKKPQSVRNYYGSLLCRPLIPQLFPGHDIYVHIDADMWVQDVQALHDYIDACRANPEHTIITPCVDASYAADYLKTGTEVGAAVRLFRRLYGEEAGDTYAYRPTLSCGMFAMHRSNPVWQEWKAHLDRNFDLDFFVESDRSASEQASLNYLLYRSMKFIPLSAAHNYNCHAGYPLRLRSTGRISVGYPPHPEIGIIHLTCFEKNRHVYYKHALLYDMGRYLTERDRQTLKLS